ncbi:isopentenyl-diphosphate delta-isomerase, type 1 [Cellulomonas flavigena DSM 20109]|uniref:Isopentenyl-diphosphate Delta-isomerase n=1 Tax=Cellulomonas flavigena (strain ATCC 482 / DSM 20109 / BCRC 11376 / JCM 18109 / NBRC 3775 / NCIMB 8073 / NRS 134) TaxID=446466 RepID=D5UL46_CELFN|nr:isopentenyl-diphosphate Delta-isomerase [Cellulomonas flavigena]ADG75928.1 isopentenyl-diphosphate delta-isomerase, type 1 [Cellulomonas flavigena DSM 20109]
MAETDLVELVDEHGRAMGETTVGAAHAAPGRLHRAFSVVLTRPDGRILLQRRAEAKLRFPGLWTNSCCGHPLPGSDVRERAALRVREELGVELVDAREVGTFRYRAADATSGHVEREHDHVIVGSCTGELAPDPAEVAETAWVTTERAHELVAAGEVTPWFADVLRLLEASRTAEPAPTP